MWRWARALATRPKVLLLDEPFGALDAKVRDELRTWLRRLHDEVHVTSLFVTHDQQEAFEVADQVIVLNKGRVEQMGPPQELYEHPATPFVTEFLGAVNVLRAETVLGMELGDEVPLPLDVANSNDNSAVYVRPHDFEITRQSNGRPAWSARIRKLIPLGGLVRLDLTLLDGTTLNVQLTRELLPGTGPGRRRRYLRLAQGLEGVPRIQAVRRELCDLRSLEFRT